MSIKSSKYVYLNFADYNSDGLARNCKFESIYKTTPLLQECSQYLCSVVGFTIPLNEMPNITDIKKIQIRSNVLPLKDSFLNTPNAIQPRVLYSKYPTVDELKNSIVAVNITNPVYLVMESSEQLINIDLYIDIVYNSGSLPLKLSIGGYCSVDVQFKRSLGMYNDI